MKAKEKYPLLWRWRTWALVVVIVVFGVFLQLEYQSEVREPSDQWSMAIELQKGVTLEHRAMDVAKLNSEQLLFGQIQQESLAILSIDEHAQVSGKASLALPTGNCKLLKLEAGAGIGTETGTGNSGNQVNAYYSNREQLWRSSITLNPDGEILIGSAESISEGTEHFDTVANWLVEGNDQQVRLRLKGKVVSEIKGYDNLRNLTVIQSDDGQVCYFVVDADSGGTLYRYSTAEGLGAWPLGSALDLKQYGMVRDMLINGDQLTLATHRYNHLAPSEPTVIGIWHFDVNTMQNTGVYYYYHVGTSLEPQLVKVAGNTVSYVLGMSQTQSITGELARYPQTESGKIVNISLLTREGNTVLENQRLTLTREYPIFYKAMDFGGKQVLLWVDRKAGEGNLRIAGASAQWQTLARERVSVDWLELFVSVLMGMGNSLVVGLMYAMIMLMDAKYILGVGLLLLLLVYKFAPVARNMRGRIVFWLAVLLTIIVKWYVYGFKAEDFKYFALMYPSFFGSTVVLQLFQLGTSAIALAIYSLWQRQYKCYKDQRIHYSVYVALEIVLLLMTTIALFMNAMMKVKFMM